MPIPTTRSALIDQISADRGRLQGELNGIDPGVAATLCVEGGWHRAGLLAVRTWWSDAKAGWIVEGRSGGVPVVPGETFSWRETPRWNETLVAAAAVRGLELPEARQELERALIGYWFRSTPCRSLSCSRSAPSTGLDTGPCADGCPSTRRPSSGRPAA